MPKVSVIIPNYNHARYLPRRIESVLGQTLRDIEVIFLDDASKDDSRRAFEPYAADPRVRAIFNDRNSGSTFRQWNRGFREATGEYLWVAESDDFAEPELLAELCGRLDANPAVGLAYCQSRRVDGEGDDLGSCAEWTDWMSEDHWAADFVTNGRGECLRYLIRQCTIPNASAALLRRSVLDRVGPAAETYRLCGDWLMWARMMLAADVAFVARPLNHFRVHTGTVRHKTTQNALWLEEKARFLLQVAREAGMTRVERREVARAVAWNWLSIRPSQGNVGVPLRRRLKVLRLMAAIDPGSLGVVARSLGREAAARLGVRGLAAAMRQSLSGRRRRAEPAAAELEPTTAEAQQ